MVIKGMLVPCQIATRDVITLFLHRLHFAKNPDSYTDKILSLMTVNHLIMFYSSDHKYRLDTEAKGSTGFRILKTLN